MPDTQLRPLGTSTIPGGRVANDRFTIDVAENAAEWLDAASSVGEVWVGFDANGRIISFCRCENDHAEESPTARKAAEVAPGSVAVCNFLASAGMLHYPRSLSVLTGSHWNGDPTLGFDGEITYGNGETVRYIRGMATRSAHEAMSVLEAIRKGSS